MENFLKELNEYYVGAKIAPGLQIAYLPDKKLFYVAVHIFLYNSIQGRSIVAKALNADLSDCITQCEQDWIAKRYSVEFHALDC